jgi:hypothetical protein
VSSPHTSELFVDQRQIVAMQTENGPPYPFLGQIEPPSYKDYNPRQKE